MKVIEMTMKQDILSSTARKAAAFFRIGKNTEISTEAFQVLLEPVKEHLYNFILKALNFSEDADDVYQETVLRAFKYKKGYDDNRPFKTWIFTVAHNEIKSYFNKRKKTPLPVDPTFHGNIVIDTGNEKLVRDIYEIAGNLNPNHRKVFFLFYDQHFSISDISRITGLKEGNIKFILNRAREQIKSNLNLDPTGRKGNVN
jgi:RNA polymerase sigma-70 factor, ECF subfamily